MTKQDIIEIAIKEFSKYGFDGLSMSKLASELKVSKPAIYHHFKDKQTLYDEMAMYLFKDMNKGVSAIIQNSNLTPKEKFTEYINLEIDAIKKCPYIVAIRLREMANFISNTNPKIMSLFEQDSDDLALILSHFKLKDIYKDLDYVLIKSMIVGTINIYYMMQMSNVDFKPLKNLDKDNEKIGNYLSKHIPNILLSALCEI